MIRKTLALCIVFLFIVSSVMPIVIGYNDETKDIDSELEAELANLRYLCTNPDGFNKAEYESYKEELLNSYSQAETSVLEPIQAVVKYDLPSPLSYGPMDSPWPMKCHDTHHTSRSPYSTADNPLEEIWKFRTGWMNSGIIIGDDDTIYFGAFDRYLHALNQYGTEKWRYKTGMWIWSTPAINEDGTVYVTSYDDYLHAVNPDGTRKWRFHAGASITASPAIADDGTIYFGTMWSLGDGGQIFAVNPDGTEKWQYQTGFHVTSDPAIADDGTVYIGSGDEYFYAINPNGTLKWRYKTGSDIKGPPSIAADGTVYVGSWDDYLYALYPNNGTMKWKHQIDAGTESNPSIGSDGTIYCGYMDLYAINPDGTRKWTFDYGGNRFSHQSSPAISADGTIYIGIIIGVPGQSDGGEILALNPDGTEKWRENIAENEVQSSPCIGRDGTLYVGSASTASTGSDYGYLHAFGEWDPTAPEAPSINGETQGYYGESYDYTFVSNDPESQDIRYYIDWGDGDFEDWIGPYPSGEEITLSHTWDEEKTYTIRARAKDTDNLWGPWGELEVTMPVNQQSYSFPLLQRLLERFPNMFPILRHLLEAQ
jgi:outer membrane protein assembly factor BamB